MFVKYTLIDFPSNFTSKYKLIANFTIELNLKTDLIKLIEVHILLFNALLSVRIECINYNIVLFIIISQNITNYILLIFYFENN